MNINTILVATIALLIGGIGGYLLHTDTRNDWHAEVMPHDMHDYTTVQTTDGVNRTNSMGNMMGMMVASEREFIEGMIPHHQEAVDTAKEVIARGGTTPEIKQLVEGIVAAQEHEIAEMKQWYQTWYDQAYVDNGEYQPMMRDLRQLSGEALDRTFLEDMIMHHMGAIMMARSVQSSIEHSEIADLTQAIITTQSDEIRQMREMLAEL